ncbi:hypothetical protein Bbelb_112610 [Branchiostoma belcheri]|nr:hypothetical protein Bbelb_112610 [Branchiostoma belcheri]
MPTSAGSPSVITPPAAPFFTGVSSLRSGQSYRDPCLLRVVRFPCDKFEAPEEHFDVDTCAVPMPAHAAGRCRVDRSLCGALHQHPPFLIHTRLSLVLIPRCLLLDPPELPEFDISTPAVPAVITRPWIDPPRRNCDHYGGDRCAVCHRGRRPYS